MSLIRVDRNGVMRFVYCDSLYELLGKGSAVVRRASHVEPLPDGSGWTADLSPVGGPVLGPYKLRNEALGAEVDWLENYYLGGDK
jgi:hypothetical protein